jgi:hypothetical protein
MDTQRETVIRVILSSAEVIGALKKAYPHDLNIQALPLNPSGRGIHLSMNVIGVAGLSITYKKETLVPGPSPIAIEHDPA